MVKKTIALWGVLLIVATATVPTQAQTTPKSASPEKECVILLHGLARTYYSMEPVAEALEAAGYRTANIDYPSTRYAIETLARRYVPEGIKRCRQANAQRIHFVTHSMGGILLRYYLSRHSIAKIGRAVMLSPPNQGSEVVDALRDNAVFQWVNGPAGQQLGTDPQSVPRQLGPVTFSLGVITGNQHSLFDTWFSDMIPGTNDGKVSVQSAKVEGMKDFLVLPHDHTFIMQEPDVIAQTLHFLKHGRFNRPKADP